MFTGRSFAMAILERHVQTLQIGPAAYWERERKFLAIEARMGGFPAKRYYALVFGGESGSITVWEREWESLALMDSTYTQMMTEPSMQELMDTNHESGVTERTEIYWVEEPQ
jgi:hypothetical protein